MAEPTTSSELLGKPKAAPIDTNVSIPRAIREAGERAEQLQRAANGEAEPSVAVQIEGQQQADPPVQQQAPQPPVQQQAPQPPPQPPATDWERNYNGLKGRYEKLVSDVSAMSEQLTRLQNENASLRQVAPSANGHAPQVRKLLTEQEIADYGEDFIDVVRRAADEVAGPLRDQVAQLQGQITTQQTEVGNAFMTRMNATIGALVPNWENLNKEPGFIQWTRLPDVFSGAIRSELMQAAWDNGDAQRVAAFFRAYLAEEAAVDPSAGQARATPGFPASLAPPAQQPLVPPAGGQAIPLQTRLSLDQLAAPGRAHSVAQMPADKPTYTAQDIARFYRDVTAGKYRGNDAQREAIDRDINLAQHEGRIITDPRTSRSMGFTGGR
jgi:hypothetical protein